MYNSQFSGHADYDKEMKQFSSPRYDGTLHGHYLRASSVSRRIEVHINIIKLHVSFTLLSITGYAVFN